MNVIFSLDAWSELWHSVKKNKLRTALTLIGVAWGMFLYISLLGAAKGMENGFNKQFEGIASNSMFVWAMQTSEPYKGFPRGRQMSLKLEDVNYIKQKVQGIENIIPRNVLGIFGTSPGQIIRGLKKGTYNTFGDYPELNHLQKINLIKGRFLNQEDINSKRKVCVIGERVEEELFEKNEESIGEYIKINGMYFQVVGVYQTRQGGMMQDNSVMMPFLTFQQIFNQGDNIGWLAVTGKDNVDIIKLEEQVKNALKEKYSVSPNDTEAFGSFNLGEMFGKIKGFLLGMQILTIFVGVLTIIAGIIAISNILLITIKERTKEIGIRRALGAKPSEIRAQVLMESVVLTLFAGISGFIFATFLLFGLKQLESPEFPLVNPTVSPINIFAAILTMTILGLLIGLLPAQRAVMIKPIEALRTE